MTDPTKPSMDMDKSPSAKTHSLKTILSYCCGNSTMEIYNAMFGTYVFFFYETEVGLYIWLITLGFVIYSLWNSINDPLLGYLFDRPNRLWKRWGKRFPLMVIAALPWFFSMYLILSPPALDPVQNALLIFFWMVIFTCSFDTFFSMFQNNHFSLFPDKFRNDTDRRKAGSLGWAIGVLGTAIGSVIPPLLITYGNKSSYSFMGLVIAFIAIGVFVLAIPGIRESKEMINRYIKVDVHKKKESFFKTMKKAVKQRNFITLVTLTFLGDVVFTCALASINYYVKYSIQKESSFATILLACTLLGSVLSVPLFLKLMQKLNDNRKAHIVGALLLIIFLMPLFFFWDVTSLLVAGALFGIGIAGFKTPRFPTMSDALDETIIKTGEHQESIYMGVQTFFQRFSLIIQAVIFAVIHETTGFDPALEQQSPLALIGLRLQASLIPAIILLVGLIVFIKFYDLKPDKTIMNKNKIIEMGL